MLKHRHSRGRDHATKILNVKYSRDFISSCALTTNCQRYYVGDTSQCGLHDVDIDDRQTKDGGRPS